MKHDESTASPSTQTKADFPMGVLKLCGNDLLWCMCVWVCVCVFVQIDWEGRAGGGWGCCWWKWCTAAALHSLSTARQMCKELQYHMLITYQGHGRRATRRRTLAGTHAHACASVTSYRAECTTRTHECHPSPLTCIYVQLCPRTRARCARFVPGRLPHRHTDIQKH